MSKGQIAGEEVLLLEPQTYMNLSGDAVGFVVRFYKAELSRLVVVHDDLDFEPGGLRVKVGGGDGGHKGVQSIAGHLGDAFIRVRIGIGKPPPGTEGAEYVLSRFDAQTALRMEGALEGAADAVELIIARGPARAMNEVNRTRVQEDEDQSAGDERASKTRRE